MIKKPISIRRSLFLYGFIPMFICSILFSIILLTSITRLMKDRAEINLINQTRILSSLLDSELKNIKRVSLNLAYSNSLQSAVQDYKNLKQITNDPTALYYGARKIQSLLGEMVGPLKQIPQVNFILPDGEMICFGMYNLSQDLPEHHLPRLRRLMKNESSSFWSPPERDYLMEKTTGESLQRNYISHYQVLYDNSRRPLGSIETKQEINRLFSGLLEISDSFKVFNTLNLQIYPSTQPYGNSYSALSDKILPYRTTRIRNSLNGGKEVLCQGITTEASWRVLTVIEENQFFSPVFRIQLILIPLVILIALLGYLISHRISLGISNSLRNLNSKLNQVQWNKSLQQVNEPDRNTIRELDDLELSFAEMNRKMDEKLDLFVAEKTLEVNARMLALQSQMDPHFLFNMLSIISIMAEEKQSGEIQKVIRHLSSLLRYVSSLQDLTVPATLELQMAEHYMKCISYRFTDSIRFTTKLPEKIDCLRIPKYTIIPLLENAVKYGMPGNRICEITLSLEYAQEEWQVEVRDNGEGFSDEGLEQLLEKINDGLNDPQKQLNSTINGMGLFNLCSRFALLYGEDFRFSAENSRDGGAVIRLGGRQSE